MSEPAPRTGALERAIATLGEALARGAPTPPETLEQLVRDSASGHARHDTQAACEAATARFMIRHARAMAQRADSRDALGAMIAKIAAIAPSATPGITPRRIADAWRMVNACAIGRGARVADASAGNGIRIALVRAAAPDAVIHTVEPDAARAQLLKTTLDTGEDTPATKTPPARIPPRWHDTMDVVLCDVDPQQTQGLGERSAHTPLHDAAAALRTGGQLVASVQADEANARRHLAQHAGPSLALHTCTRMGNGDASTRGGASLCVLEKAPATAATADSAGPADRALDAPPARTTPPPGSERNDPQSMGANQNEPAWRALLTTSTGAARAVLDAHRALDNATDGATKDARLAELARAGATWADSAHAAAQAAAGATPAPGAPPETLTRHTTVDAQHWAGQASDAMRNAQAEPQWRYTGRIEAPAPLGSLYHTIGLTAWAMEVDATLGRERLLMLGAEHARALALSGRERDHAQVRARIARHAHQPDPERCEYLELQIRGTTHTPGNDEKIRTEIAKALNEQGTRALGTSAQRWHRDDLRIVWE